MLKQIYAIAALLLLCLPLLSQNEYYRFAHSELHAFVEAQKDTYDIVIPIEERIPVMPRSLATGNWGATWHGSVKNATYIRQNAKRKVVVFVFDTGAGYSNTYLNAAWWKGKEKVFTGEKTTVDVQSHSTHVSGIIGAVHPDYPIGIAAELVKIGYLKIIPYKVLNDGGSGQYAWIANAVADANKEAEKLIKDGYFVIYNFSLGGGGSDSSIEKVLATAKKLGVFVACASGNTYNEGVNYPGSSTSVYAIAALQQSGSSVARAPFSTYGKEVFLAGAGNGILSTIPNNQFAEYSGTSMATPTVAAIAAIAGALYPDLNAEGVAALLAKGFDINPKGRDIYTGYGSPMVDSLIGKTPDNPEPPQDTIPTPPVDTTPQKVYKSRIVSVPIRAGFENILWKGQSDGKFRFIGMAGLIVEYRTTEPANVASARLNKATEEYFRQRGYVLPDNQGDIDFAAGWVAYFYRMLMKEQGFDVTIAEAWVSEGKGEDRTLVLYTKAFPVGLSAGKMKKYVNQGKATTLTW